jgi:hypothetical protein
MTVDVTTNEWEYTGDGATLAFAYTNRIFATTDLKVYKDGVLQASGYTVSGVDVAGGGAVTFAVAPASAVVVRILRDVPATQALNYEAGSVFPAETTEKGFDKAVVLAQQLAYKIARALRWPDSEAAAPSAVLPAKADRLGKFLYFDAVTGAPTVATPTNTTQSFTAIGTALAGAATAAAARLAIGLANLTFQATGSKVRLYELAGSADPNEDGLWILWNAEYGETGSYFSRIDTTKVAYGLHFANNITGESATGGVIVWRARPSSEASTPQTPAKKITPWTVGVELGAWEPIAGGTEFRDLFFGGFMIEADGAGNPPFSRFGTRRSGTEQKGAITRFNAYADNSGADRINRKSVDIGVAVDESGSPPYPTYFIVDVAPEGNSAGGNVIDPNPAAFVRMVNQKVTGRTGSKAELVAVSASFTGKATFTVGSGDLTSSGTTCTLIDHTAHGLAVGDWVTVSGATQTAYNGTWRVATVPDANTITFVVDSTPSASPATTGSSILVNGIDVLRASGVEKIVNDDATADGWFEIHFVDDFASASAFTTAFDCNVTGSLSDGRYVGNRTRNAGYIRGRFSDAGGAVALGTTTEINFMAVGERA